MNRVCCLGMTLGAVLLKPALPAYAADGGFPSRVRYDQLRAEFGSPDHARWGEVPIWWWNGEEIRKDRLTWQWEALAAQGVKAVCPIESSENCSPRFFSPEWWELFQQVHQECERLGMSLWLYDQVGYGDYGWFDKALEHVQGGDPTLYLNPQAADALIDLFYGEVERRLGHEAMGTSFVGFFQDEPSCCIPATTRLRCAWPTRWRRTTPSCSGREHQPKRCREWPGQWSCGSGKNHDSGRNRHG